MSSISSSAPTRKTSVRASQLEIIKIIPGTTLSLENSPLEAVYIYFDTSTHDEIERDVKVELDLLNL